MEESVNKLRVNITKQMTYNFYSCVLIQLCVFITFFIIIPRRQKNLSI